jgi:glycosyltransferase involved in cell wall biosynthesis
MRLRRAEHRTLRAIERSPASFDVVVATDLRFPGGTSSSLVDEITAATNSDYRIGLIHLANPRLGRALPVQPALRALIDSARAQLLLPGEAATARLGLVKHPMVFADWPGGRLPIEVERVLITVGQVPADRHGVYYDPAAVTESVAEAFGAPPQWAPVSGAVRAALSAVEPTDDDWVEVIDQGAWSSATTTTSEGAAGPDRADERIVIGRHSRPDPLKWPATADEIRAAYPVDGRVRVRILGGADAAVELLGEVPEQWEVLPFGLVTAREFLAGLDAFVYFHHPDLTEAFGRTILEAIAAGVPAVVPGHFEALFGEACLYATPDTAVDTVRALVADPDARHRHVARAAEIARERFGHDAHVARLAALIGPPAGGPSGPAAPPQLDQAPAGHRHAVATTLVTAFGTEGKQLDTLLRSLEHQRRQAPGFVPVVVITVTRPPLTEALGIETRVITSRAGWTDASEPWETYAQRRLRQLAGHYGVDNIAVADPTHPDAWIALQMRPPGG